MPIDIQSLMAALQARGGGQQPMMPPQMPQQMAPPGGVSTGGREFPMDAIRRRIGQMGGTVPEQEPMPPVNDPRGLEGILARGSNVYNGAGNAAHSGGGPQFGRPPTDGPMRPPSAPSPVDMPGMAQPSGLAQIGAQPPGMMPGMEGLMPPQNAILRRIQAQRSGHGLFA